MIDNKVFFIVPGLYLNAGGLTKATYDKANFLSDFFSVEVLSTGYQGNFQKIHEDLVKAKKLNKNVTVRNMFHDLAQRNTKVTPRFTPDYEGLLTGESNVVYDKNSERTRIFGEDGLYRNFISHPQGKLHFIDCMDEHNPTLLRKRFSFQEGALLSQETFVEGARAQQIIYNRNRVPILNMWFENNRMGRVFDMLGDEVVDSRQEEIIKKWLQSVINPYDIVLIDCFFEKVAGYLDGIGCATVGFVHSHENYDHDARFAKQFSGFDRFVFLTDLQRSKFDQYNPALTAKSSTLPHPVMVRKAPGAKDNKIVTISRLVHNKPVALAIEAFALIADKYPELTYEIYGIGPDRPDIQALIEKLQLSERVFLKDYTKNPLGVFEKAQLSINLTKYEGFGLSIAESLGMSCPVVTSRVDYGPSELVQDGYNGRLVDNQNVAGIAQAISDVLDNASTYQAACLPSIERYSYDQWKLNLLEVMNEAVEARESAKGL